MSFAPVKNYQEIIINFQTERHDDHLKLQEDDSFEKENKSNKGCFIQQKQTIQSSNSIPTKSSPLSLKSEEMISSQFSFNQKCSNQAQKIPRNYSQSSLGSQYNPIVAEQEQQTQQNEQRNSLSNKKLQQHQHIQDRLQQNQQQLQQYHKQQQQQQQTGVYQINYNLKQQKIQNDFSLQNLERRNSNTDSAKKKPSPLKLSPTMKPIINQSTKKNVSQFDENDTNKRTNDDYNYFQQFESFSAKNDQSSHQKNRQISPNNIQNQTLSISDLSAQEREEKIINLQKKYIENYDDNADITMEQLTIDSHSTNDPRMSQQQLIFLKNKQESPNKDQFDSPQQFQDISQDTARHSQKTRNITDNSFFKDPINNLNEKSTCRNNYGQSPEESQQQEINQQSTQTSKQKYSNCSSSADNYEDLQSTNKPQKIFNCVTSSTIDNQTLIFNNQSNELKKNNQYLQTNQYLQNSGYHQNSEYHQNNEYHQDSEFHQDSELHQNIEYKNNYKNKRSAEKENKYNKKTLLQSQRENKNEVEIERQQIQREAGKVYESQKLSEIEVLMNEKILLQQELNIIRQNAQQTIEYYEKEILILKNDISQYKEQLKIQELSLQEQTVQQEIDAQKQGKNEQLQQLIKQIQTIDVHTEQVFSKKLEKERRQKEEIIEKNIMLQEQIKDLQNSLNYCRDYLKCSEDVQMKQTMEQNEGMQIQLDSKDEQLFEERRQHKQQINAVNEQFNKITADHSQYIHQTEKQIANIEIFYKKQLDDFKKTYETSILKTKCITDEFERLMNESNRNKELLVCCQKQLKNCEIRNSQLTENNIQLNLKVDDFTDDVKEREQEKEALLKEVNQQAQCIDQQEKEIERLRAEEEDYKKLQFAFEIEGKRIQELQIQVDRMNEIMNDQNDELQQFKINYEEKLTENKIVKEEFENYMERHSKTNDINIENEKEKMNLEQSIIQLRLLNESLTAANQNLEYKAQKMTQNIQNQQDEIEKKDNLLSKSMRKEDKSNRRNSEQISSLRFELEQLQISEKLKQEEIIKLKQKIKKIENESFLQLEEFKIQLESSYNNLINKQQGDNNFENQKEQFQNEILALKKQICDLESDHSLKLLENQRLQREIDEKNDDIERLFNRLKDTEVQKSQLNLQIQEFETYRRNDLVDPNFLSMSGLREGEQVRQLKLFEQIRRKSYQEEDEDIQSYSSAVKPKSRILLQNLEDNNEVSRSMDFTKAIDQFSFNEKMHLNDQKQRSKVFSSLLDTNQINMAVRSSLFKSPNWQINEQLEQSAHIELNNLSSSNINISQNMIQSHKSQSAQQAIEQQNSSRVILKNGKLNIQASDEIPKFYSPQDSVLKNSRLDSQQLSDRHQKLQSKLNVFKMSFFSRSAKISKFIQLMKQKTNKYIFSRLQLKQFKMIDDTASAYAYYVQNKYIKEKEEDGKEKINLIKKCINGNALHLLHHSFSSQRQIIKDRKFIMKKYFKSQLLYDLLIYLFYFVGLKEQKLTYFQFFILIRVKKIFELLKQMFTRMDQEQNYYFYTKIFRIVATILITCHIISCVFISLGLSNDDELNWIQKHFKNNGTEINNMSIYVTGLYWSVVTMITIGYGDVVPINTSELVKEIQREKKLSKNKLQKLNRHMNERGVPKNVKQQVKKYYEYINRENQRNSSEGQEMISSLPQTLKDEVMSELYVKVIMQNKIFSLNFSSNFIREISLMVKEIKIGPEIIFFNQDQYLDKIYFVLKGNLQMMRQVKRQTFINLQTLKKGDTLGQIEFFTEQKTECLIKTLDVVTLAYITLNDFKQTISKFPEEYEKYHSIKDKANLQQDFQGLDMQCLSCHQYSHKISDCPSLKYQPNVTKSIYQFNNTDKFQERQSEIKRKEKKRRFNPISNSHQVQNSAYIYQKNNRRRGRVTILLNSAISPYQNNSSPFVTTDQEEDSQAFQGNFGNVPDEKKRKSFFMNKNYIVTPTEQNTETIYDRSISHDTWEEQQLVSPINQNRKHQMPKARKSLYIQKQIVQQLQKEIETQLAQEIREEALKLEKQRFPQLSVYQQQNMASQHNINSNTSISTVGINAPINSANLHIPNLGNGPNINTSIYYNNNSQYHNNNSDTNSIYQQRRISAHSPIGNEFEDFFENDHLSGNNVRIRQLSNQGGPPLVSPNRGGQAQQFQFPPQPQRMKNGSFSNIQMEGKQISPPNVSVLEFGSIQNIIANTTSNNIIQNNNINSNLNSINNNNSSIQTNTSIINTTNIHKSPNIGFINNSLMRGETLAGSQFQRLQPSQILTQNDIGSISQYDNNHQYEDDTINTKTHAPTIEKKRLVGVDQNIYSHLNNLNSPFVNRNEFYTIILFDKMKSYTYYFPHNNFQNIIKQFKKQQLKEIKKKKIRITKYQNYNNNNNNNNYNKTKTILKI